MTDRMRVAVVGYGQVAALHARIIGGQGHLLEWVIGRRPDQTRAFGTEFGFARHGTDLDAALADAAVDAVVLCTPNDQHAGQARACLQAGKHVLVEIPLAMSYPQARELAALARTRDLTLMVAHTHRYQGAMRQLRELVVNGDVTFCSVISRYLLMRRRNVGSTGYVRSWTDSLLWHHANHALDIVLWLLGVAEPGQAEIASMLALPDSNLRTPFDLSLIVRTRTDQLGTVAMSYNNDASLVYDFYLTGAGRSYAIENGTLRDRTGVLYDASAEQEADTDRVLQDQEFFAAIRAGRPALTSAEAVFPALELLQRVQDSYDAWRPADATHQTPTVRPPSTVRM